VGQQTKLIVVQAKLSWRAGRLPLRDLELQYELKNISRAEPPASVFEVPAGYEKHDRQPADR
jgi:hypothetical protein